MTDRVFFALALAMVAVPALAHVDSVALLPEPGTLILFGSGAAGTFVARTMFDKI